MSRLLRLDPNFKPAFDGLKAAREVVEKLSGFAPVEAAYLFGSSAKGKNTTDSDLDIVVVIPDSQSLETYIKIVGRSHFSPVAVDWIFKTRSEFDRQLVEGGISRLAQLDGVKVYPYDSNK